MYAFHEKDRGLKAEITGLIRFERGDLAYLAHWHHEIEVTLVEAGVLVLGGNGVVCSLEAGSVAFFGSGSIHHYGLSPGSRAKVLMFPATFLGQGVWPDTGRSFFFVQPGHELAAELRSLFLHLYEEGGRMAPGTDLIVKGLAGVLCGTALRSQASFPGSARQDLLPLARLRESLDYLHAHFTEPVDLKILADRAHLSYHHFSRLLHEGLGLGFKEYLNRLRIHEAERLLADSECNVTEAAFASGFQSLSAFHRAYRKLRGHSPGHCHLPENQYYARGIGEL